MLGKVPTISIDKTDGCQMFLSKDSVGVEIITAKSSEMNVMIPNGEDFVSDFLSRWESTISLAKWSQLEIIGGWFPHMIKYFM